MGSVSSWEVHSIKAIAILFFQKPADELRPAFVPYTPSGQLSGREQTYPRSQT